jgi:hypothetical protein
MTQILNAHLPFQILTKEPEISVDEPSYQIQTVVVLVYIA